VLKKRLIGVVTVKDSWAVQSIGYRDYLPLGKPEYLVENLDRWGADEIVIQCIDRSSRELGPDYVLLDKIARLGLGTPLIYSGGINNVKDGVKVIQAGADRIVLDSMLHLAPEMLFELGHLLGVQALIAAVPLRMQGNIVVWRDYRNKLDRSLRELEAVISRGAVSELLVIDYHNEGKFNSFNTHLLDPLQGWDVPQIVFGGISENEQLQALLLRPGIVGVAVGNFLSYREFAIQQIKKALNSPELRPACYSPSER
jgi:cyclase